MKKHAKTYSSFVRRYANMPKIFFCTLAFFFPSLFINMFWNWCGRIYWNSLSFEWFEWYFFSFCWLKMFESHKKKIIVWIFAYCCIIHFDYGVANAKRVSIQFHYSMATIFGSKYLWIERRKKKKNENFSNLNCNFKC